MFNVSPVIYGKVAEMIIDRMGHSDFMSESIEFETEGVEYKMLFSAVVFRERIYMPVGEYDRLVDLVPVWWEFHTYAEEGEVLNDFCFNDLKQYFN